MVVTCSSWLSKFVEIYFSYCRHVVLRIVTRGTRDTVGVVSTNLKYNNTILLRTETSHLRWVPRYLTNEVNLGVFPLTARPGSCRSHTDRTGTNSFADLLLKQKINFNWIEGAAVKFNCRGTQSEIERTEQWTITPSRISSTFYLCISLSQKKKKMESSSPYTAQGNFIKFVVH